MKTNIEQLLKDENKLSNISLIALWNSYLVKETNQTNFIYNYDTDSLLRTFEYEIANGMEYIEDILEKHFINENTSNNENAYFTFNKEDKGVVISGNNDHELRQSLLQHIQMEQLIQFIEKEDISIEFLSDEFKVLQFYDYIVLNKELNKLNNFEFKTEFHPSEMLELPMSLLDLGKKVEMSLENTIDFNCYFDGTLLTYLPIRTEGIAQKTNDIVRTNEYLLIIEQFASAKSKSLSFDDQQKINNIEFHPKFDIDNIGQKTFFKMPVYIDDIYFDNFGENKSVQMNQIGDPIAITSKSIQHQAISKFTKELNMNLNQKLLDSQMEFITDVDDKLLNTTIAEKQLFQEIEKHLGIKNKKQNKLK